MTVFDCPVDGKLVETNKEFYNSSHSTSIDTAEEEEEEQRVSYFFKRYSFGQAENLVQQGGQAKILKGYDLKENKHVAVKVFEKKNMCMKAIRAARLEQNLMTILNH